ncbi:hypothetical protein [Actinomyces timonensis]|uniref:hypothetical protein n=1 Tax=Actinomyces timonensis TaxID=1288391 RepID=UPI00030B1323|nr:hypothetical protein [Actinomyces timonensis]
MSAALSSMEMEPPAAHRADDLRPYDAVGLLASLTRALPSFRRLLGARSAPPRRVR